MIVSCSLLHLEQRASERCYTMAEVSACITSRNGLDITVDTDHAAYPRSARPGCVPHSVSLRQGVGTELKALLSLVGITSTPECKCDRRARHMDEQGVAWCIDNVEVIVGWLREAAHDRGLPFVDVVGRQVVRMAIARARRRLEA